MIEKLVWKSPVYVSTILKNLGSEDPTDRKIGLELANFYRETRQNQRKSLRNIALCSVLVVGTTYAALTAGMYGAKKTIDLMFDNSKLLTYQKK
ncbi:MAG TPA: hypothetical protein VK158_00270 [Acidobacteriota bacterium]|nr:hypothetical protein [Acidobacteriota bacterium]